MKLDNNMNTDGRGKYTLINNRTNKVQYGNEEGEEFFVIKLKDKNAAAALHAYANSCKNDDWEFSKEVHLLACKAEAGQNRMPD